MPRLQRRWNVLAALHNWTTLSDCIFATTACIDNHVLVIRWTLAH